MRSVPWLLMRWHWDVWLLMLSSCNMWILIVRHEWCLWISWNLIRLWILRSFTTSPNSISFTFFLSMEVSRESLCLVVIGRFSSIDNLAIFQAFFDPFSNSDQVSKARRDTSNHFLIENWLQGIHKHTSNLFFSKRRFDLSSKLSPTLGI